MNSGGTLLNYSLPLLKAVHDCSQRYTDNFMGEAENGPAIHVKREAVYFLSRDKKNCLNELFPPPQPLGWEDISHIYCVLYSTFY